MRETSRYRVVVYEESGEGGTTVVMDASGEAFLAAVGTIREGRMSGQEGGAGPQETVEHLRLLIAQSQPPPDRILPR